MANITTAFVKQFQSTVEILYRQRGSKLMGVVSTEMIQGEQKLFELSGTHEAYEQTSRFQDVIIGDTERQRRMCSTRPYRWASMIDDFDRVRTLIDLNSDETQAGMDTLGLKIDKVIIDAALGTAYGGYDGTTAYTFDTTNQQIAVNLGGGGSDVGLNVVKLGRALQKLRSAHAMVGDLVCIVNAKAIEQLLTETKFGSADYNAVRVLVNGEPGTFMGFRFVHSEAIGVDGNGDMRIIAMNTRAVKMGIAKPLQVSVDTIPMKGNATLVQAVMMVGAVRMQEAGVVEILCDPN